MSSAGASRRAAGAAAAAGPGSAPARPRRRQHHLLRLAGLRRGLSVDDFLKKNDITLETTYIGNNDEIVTKLTAGGVGSIDIVTPYMGYVPLLVALDVIQPIDEALVPNLADVMALFRNDKNINVDGMLYGVPFTWGSAPMMYDPAVDPDGAGESGRI